MRILLFRVLYSGPLFSESPIWSKRNCLLDRDLSIRCGREAEKDKQKGPKGTTEFGKEQNLRKRSMPVERDWEFETQRSANCSNTI